MSTTDSVRANRDHIKPYRQSSLIQGNVVAFVFRPIDLQSISSSPRTILKSSSSTKDGSEEDDITYTPVQLLKAFIDANKSSLNRKLAESFNELRLFGWYASCTLLLSGPNEDVEVLKNAWSQRILRNPKGYVLKDVGTVKDFVVEWIPHSHFISLTTALHDTVMELDRGGRCASRDAIVRYLKSVYHDVRIPSEDIIHKCLGRLIEQRKIYHDGVGYRALIDNSPLHKVRNPEEKQREESEGVSVKLSVRTSRKSKSDNGSVGSSSVAGKPRRCKSSRKNRLSDGSSKDEKMRRPYSDEDGARFNLPSFDHVVNTGDATMKTIAHTDKKKISPLATSPDKLAVYIENSEEQDIKIIDISERRSVLRHIHGSNMRDTKCATTHPVGSKNGDLFYNHKPPNEKNPGQPYEKHSREVKPTKRPKPQRSRSFTDPSKHRAKYKNPKGGADGDFPLRRVMGTEELRVISKVDLTEKTNENDCKSDKCKNGNGDKEKKDKLDRRQQRSGKPSSEKSVSVGDGILPENRCFDDTNEDSPVSTVSAKSNKLTVDSDTPSGTYASDASSPFQSKKRKDLVETMVSEQNNNFESGMTYLCLTGKMKDDSFNVGNEAAIRENTLKKANGITTENFDVNIADSSIFDCVSNSSDGVDYHCEDDMEFKDGNFDSLTIGYSV